MSDLAARISMTFRRLFRGTKQDDIISRGMGPIEKAAFERYKANVPEGGNIFWRCKFDGQPVGVSAIGAENPTTAQGFSLGKVTLPPPAASLVQPIVSRSRASI